MARRSAGRPGASSSSSLAAGGSSPSSPSSSFTCLRGRVRTASSGRALRCPGAHCIVRVRTASSGCAMYRLTAPTCFASQLLIKHANRAVWRGGARVRAALVSRSCSAAAAGPAAGAASAAAPSAAAPAATSAAGAAAAASAAAGALGRGDAARRRHEGGAADGLPASARGAGAPAAPAAGLVLLGLPRRPRKLTEQGRVCVTALTLPGCTVQAQATP